MLDDVDPSPEVDDEERPQTPEPIRTAVSYHLSFRKYGHGPRNLRWAWLFGFGLATPKARGGWYVRHRRIPRTDFLDDTTAAVYRQLEAAPRVYHNALEARLIERRYGIGEACEWDDVRILASLLEIPRIEMADLAAKFFIPAPDSVPSRRQSYLARDNAEMILSLAEEFDWGERIEREGLKTVYDLERAVVEPTATMIENGLAVDRQGLDAHVDDLRRQMHAAKNELEQLTGRCFRSGNPEDVSDVLHRVLKLPVRRRNRNTSPASDQRTLERLVRRDTTGAAGHLLASLRATTLWRNALAILMAIEFKTGRIYPDLDPLGIAGRFVCKTPLLPAIPDCLSDVIVAREGFVLLEAEYSEIELRILTHFSRDESLLEAFCIPQSSVDLRRRTAAAALGIPEERVTTKELHRLGRLIEHGQAFRLSDLGVARELEINVEEAEEIIGRLLARFAGVQQWISATDESVEKDGEARSLYGRRRTLSDEALLSNEGEDSTDLDAAVDFRIAATAADILKSKLAGLYEALPADCRLLLPLEHGVLMEVPRGRVREAAKIVRRTMEERPAGFDVPLPVKMRGGRTWADCKAGPSKTP